MHESQAEALLFVFDAMLRRDDVAGLSLKKVVWCLEQTRVGRQVDVVQQSSGEPELEFGL